MYDPTVFVDRPLSLLAANSMSAERDAGGWRGFAGIPIERKWSDIFTIDVFLTRERPDIIIELGTGSGAFSCYLATYAFLAGAEFHTFDTHLRGSPTKRINYRAQRLIARLGGKTHRRDVFSLATVTLISKITRQPRTAFVYCDNGDKIREVRTFAEHLKVGDFLGVHDFGSEIQTEDISYLTQTGRFIHWNANELTAAASSNRLLQRVK